MNLAPQVASLATSNPLHAPRRGARKRVLTERGKPEFSVGLLLFPVNIPVGGKNRFAPLVLMTPVSPSNAELTIPLLQLAQPEL